MELVIKDVYQTSVADDLAIGAVKMASIFGGILGVSSTTGGHIVRAVRPVAVRKAVDESSSTRILGWFVSEIIPVRGFFSVVNVRIACRILDATHLFSTDKNASGLLGVC